MRQTGWFRRGRLGLRYRCWNARRSYGSGLGRPLIGAFVADRILRATDTLSNVGLGVAGCPRIPIGDSLIGKSRDRHGRARGGFQDRRLGFLLTRSGLTLKGKRSLKRGLWLLRLFADRLGAWQPGLRFAKLVEVHSLHVFDARPVTARRTNRRGGFTRVVWKEKASLCWMTLKG